MEQHSGTQIRLLWLAVLNPMLMDAGEERSGGRGAGEISLADKTGTPHGTNKQQGVQSLQGVGF